MANEKRPTAADKIAFYAIKEFLKENGYPPSVRELCRLTGKSSTASIQYRLRSLEQKGYIKTTDRGKRTIRITKGMDDVPTVEFAEVVHGRWIKDQQSKFEHRYNCSACGYRLIDEPCNYCPNCGAKMMDGDSDA